MTTETRTKTWKRAFAELDHDTQFRVLCKFVELQTHRSKIKIIDRGKMEGDHRRWHLYCAGKDRLLAWIAGDELGWGWAVETAKRVRRSDWRE